jgi:phage tail-like protein
MSNLFTSGRFYIFIGSEAQALFTELSGLQVETEVYEYAEGGNNGFVHQLPGRTRVGRITLKQGMTTTNTLFLWYMDIAYGKKVDRRNVSVAFYNEAGTELRRWNFINAYPVRWVGPQLEAGTAATAIETLELAHDGLQLG